MLTPEQQQQVQNYLKNKQTTTQPQQTDLRTKLEQAYIKKEAENRLFQPKEKEGFLKSIGKAIISSERGLANTLGGAVSTLTPEYKTAQASQVALDDMNVKLGQAIVSGKKEGKDTSRLENLYRENTERVFNPSEITGGAIDKSIKQIAGEAGGVALDVATAGVLAKGASTFKMFGAAEKAAAAKKASQGISLAKAIAENIEGTYKATTSAKLLDIGRKAAPTIAKGASIGYGYDVTTGLQEGESTSEAMKPGLGTVAGAAIPGIGAIKKATGVVAKQSAPRVINSLIKPLLKDFSYGKNPGRAVAEEGIVANSIEDLASKISSARQKTGQEIGELSQTLQGQAKLSVEDALNPINTAMKEAAKTNNSTLLKRLQAVKEAITENLTVGVDEVGNPTIISQGKKDLSSLDFNDAFKLKSDIGDMTQWTGNVSDDKIVNKALKQVYGSIKQEINDTAMMVDRASGERLKRLNEKYADLTSAEVAAKYRDKLSQKQNLVSLTGKLGTVAGVSAALLSGEGLGLTTILAGVAGATLDKALGSTAVKTRLAKMLAGEAPGVIEKLLNNNQKVRQAIYDAFTVDKTQDTKNLLNKVNNWLNKNVKAGLTIEDVSKLTPEEQALRGFNKGAVPQTALPIKKSVAKVETNPLIQEAKKFERAKNLTPEYRDIETKAFDKIQSKENEILSKYSKENGNYVNADDLRKEFVDVGYNGQNAASVQEPVSYLSKKAYTNALKNEGKYATFSCGMSGAGKTSALKNIPEYDNIIKDSAVIFDSNLSSYDSAVKKINEAIKAGKLPEIWYTYREPIEGFENGVVKRMKNNKSEMGRVVPTKIISENAPGSLEVAERLHNEGIKVHFIDNSFGDPKLAKEVPLQEIKNKAKYPPNLKSKLDNKAKELYEQGTITREQYEAITS